MSSSDFQPTPFDHCGAWADPDPMVLADERPPAPIISPEDLQWLAGSFATWVKEAAEAKSAPVEYVLLGVLVSAGVLICNNRQVGVAPDWVEPPILWGMLVGDPSSGKSPALDAVLDPIEELDREHSKEYAEAFKVWKTKEEIAAIIRAEWNKSVKKSVQEGNQVPPKPNDADAGSKPTQKRIIITDSTIEKVAEIGAGTRRGILAYWDELSGWLCSMERYNGGGDRPFWLHGFGGRRYSVDRKSQQDPIIVDRLALSVLGGIQPEKLDALLVKSADDGLLARFIVAFPSPAPLSRSNTKLDGILTQSMAKHLFGLQPIQDEKGTEIPLTVPLSDPAKDAFFEFRVQCQTWGGDAEGPMKSHVGKMPGIVARVALILAHMDWAATDAVGAVSIIEASHIKRACFLVGDIFRHHAKRAYGVAALAPELQNARRLAKLIKAKELTVVEKREVLRKRIAGLDRVELLNKAIIVLEDANWLLTQTTQTKGRNKTRYLVNPKVFNL